MSENVMFQEAIDATRQGQRIRARDLLTRLLRADQSNPEYWLWMSSVVDSQKEQIFCLRSVLRLDPSNRAAEQGLILLGASQANQWVQPVPPLRRQWQPALEDVPKPTGLKAVWANPALRALAFAGLAIIVIGLIYAGIFGLGNRSRVVAYIPTHTPGPSPTVTDTPTLIPMTRVVVITTPTPTFIGPTPLWMLLDATYTPTPVYVNTPHPVNEAFRVGLRAFGQGNLTTALQYIQQASKVDPKSADIQYYLGEIHRMQREYEQALDDYANALELNANFAPAFLGRAQVNLALNKKADVSDDLKSAIEKDSKYGQAYLAEAAFYLSREDPEAALGDLKFIEDLLPDSPLLFLYRGQAELMLGENEAALQNAQRAVELDRTSLPAFLLLGQTSALNSEFDAAEQALQTYLTYEPEQASAWLELGKVYYLSGKNFPAAIDALDKALELDDESGEAYLYRGLISLELGNGQDAVNDLITARKFDTRSFLINLALGRALLAAERFNEAYNQIDATENLAESDEELAQVYYWRALALEAKGSDADAVTQWRTLLDLPKTSYPTQWPATVQAHLEALYTATPTATFTATFTPTPTQTPTRTPTPTRTNTPTRTFTPSPTVTISPTSRPSATPSATLTSTIRAQVTNTPTP
jgi:tetratricopeptide (TPR) repeat protein